MPRPDTSVMIGDVEKSLCENHAFNGIVVLGHFQPQFFCLGFDCRRVYASAVVAYGDKHLRALGGGLDFNRRFQLFAGGQALFACLDAMIAGIAHKMHNRVAQLFEDISVYFYTHAVILQIDALVACHRYVTDDTVDTLASLADGYHAQAVDPGGDLGDGRQSGVCPR